MSGGGEMVLMVEQAFALWLIVMGLSHLAAPAAWSELFAQWRDKGDAGGLRNGLLHLAPAVLLVGLHPVFTGAGLLTTLLGWLLLLKGLAYVVAPAALMKVQAAADGGGPWRYRAAGAGLVLLGLVIGSLSFRSEIG